MGSHRERPPLILRPRFSRRLLAFVLVGHGAALAACAALPGAWKLAGLAVAASLVRQLRVHVLRRSPASVESLVWRADGSWQVRLVSGAEREAVLSPASFVSLPLVVLNLRAGPPLRGWSVPLFADALAPQVLRRLRLRLRIEGARARESDPPAA